MPGKTGNKMEDGANAVEFAIVLPVLVMLLFGILTGGLLLSDQQQINHAAREASRFGATLTPFDPALVAQRAQTTGTGLIQADEALICVGYGSGASFTATWYEFDTLAAPVPAPPPGDCADEFGGDATAGERVQVVIRSPGRLEAVLFRSNLTLVASAVSVYEPEP